MNARQAHREGRLSRDAVVSAKLGAASPLAAIAACMLGETPMTRHRGLYMVVPFTGAETLARFCRPPSRRIRSSSPPLPTSRTSPRTAAGCSYGRAAGLRFYADGEPLQPTPEVANDFICRLPDAGAKELRPFGPARHLDVRIVRVAMPVHDSRILFEQRVDIARGEAICSPELLAEA